MIDRTIFARTQDKILYFRTYGVILSTEHEKFKKTMQMLRHQKSWGFRKKKTSTHRMTGRQWSGREVDPWPVVPGTSFEEKWPNSENIVLVVEKEDRNSHL